MPPANGETAIAESGPKKWVLHFGGLCGIIAADQWLTSRLPNGVENVVDSSGTSQLDLVEGQDALTDKILAALP